MRRLLLLAALLLLPLVAAPAPVLARGSSAVAEALAKRIQARIRKARLNPDQVGVVVLTRERKPTVRFTTGSSRPLVPASAAKVMTAASALDHLGPGHVFRTLVSVRGSVSDAGVLDGDLVLHGSGDPSISGRFHDGNPMAVPAALAQQVFDAGIRRVTGALVLDEGPFDLDFVHDDWTAADKRRWYGAPVGGLAFNDGCVDVQITAGRSGTRPALRLPATAGPWRVRNTLKTVSGARTAVGGRWTEDGATLEIHGRVRPRGKASFHVPVRDPARFFGGALHHALQGAGVRVDGRVRRPRDRADRTPGRVVALHESELPPALQVMNVRSQNVYASLLFKLAGAQLTGEASWASGGEAVRAMLARRRIADGGTTDIRDGSGLSTRNRVSAGVLAQVLHAFDHDLLRGPLLFESLPVSGTSGTLRKRLRDRGIKGRVHAKTGTLNDVRARALAGYVDGRGGESGLVFAILLNGPGASHAVIDDLVREICR